MQAGKGAGYERWAKVYNLKQMAAALKTAIVDYAKTRPIFERYKASKYSRKFLAEHEGEIALYRAATAQFDALLGEARQEKNKEQER